MVSPAFVIYLQDLSLDLCLQRFAVAVSDELKLVIWSHRNRRKYDNKYPTTHDIHSHFLYNIRNLIRADFARLETNVFRKRWCCSKIGLACLTGDTLTLN